MVTKCSCPGCDALRALPAFWWPALYNRLHVSANICLRDPHLYMHKHTHTYFPKGLITASYENGPMRVRSIGKSAEAQGEACQQCRLHQSGPGTRLPVIRSMRYVVGMWDFFSFFVLFFVKGSLPRRNGFAGLLWSLLYDSFICFSHIPSQSRTWRNVLWIRSLGKRAMQPFHSAAGGDMVGRGATYRHARLINI